MTPFSPTKNRFWRTVCVPVLCALVLASCADGSKVGCVVSTAITGHSANVTCYFAGPVVASDSIIVIDRYGANDTRETVLECFPDKANTSSCTVKPGYRFDDKIGDAVTLDIPVMSQDLAGLYICQHLSSGPREKTGSCNLTDPSTMSSTIGILNTTTSDEKRLTVSTTERSHVNDMGNNGGRNDGPDGGTVSLDSTTAAIVSTAVVIIVVVVVGVVFRKRIVQTVRSRSPQRVRGGNPAGVQASEVDSTREELNGHVSNGDAVSQDAGEQEPNFLGDEAAEAV